jgi:hypothetical protein
VLRKFGPKREEVAGDWTIIKELHNLYASPDSVRVIKSSRRRWAGYVVLVEEVRNAYKLLVRKPNGKKPLGRPRRRWEDNIRMDLREIVWKFSDWMHLAQDRDQWQTLVYTVMNIRIPSKAGNFLTS